MEDKKKILEDLVLNLKKFRRIFIELNDLMPLLSASLEKVSFEEEKAELAKQVFSSKIDDLVKELCYVFMIYHSFCKQTDLWGK